MGRQEAFLPGPEISTTNKAKLGYVATILKIRGNTLLLRERQKEFLDRTRKALSQNDNTLGIAPTGAGKTILFSHLLGQLIRDDAEKKALVLAHRDELTVQNSDKFKGEIWVITWRLSDC